jgi:superfamily II DNA/RNA helicase
MIIFTRNIHENRKLFQELIEHGNYDSAIFDAEKTYSYWDFVSGHKHILIADEEMGVGINLPNVVSVVHWGLPNSKAQYIQEIGRANRCGRNASSIVIFQGIEYLTPKEKRLFQYETSIDDVIDIIRDDQISKESVSLFSSILADGEDSKMSVAKICSFYDRKYKKSILSKCL